MEQRLRVVTLGVVDLEPPRCFYEEGLGWRRGNASKKAMSFQVGGAALAEAAAGGPTNLLERDPTADA